MRIRFFLVEGVGKFVGVEALGPSWGLLRIRPVRQPGTVRSSAYLESPVTFGLLSIRGTFLPNTAYSLILFAPKECGTT